MKKLFGILNTLTIFCFVQCIVEHSYLVNSILVNESGKSIQIMFYKGGNLNPEFEVVISTEERKQVSSNETFTYAGLLSINDFDSLVVKYDNDKRSVHYGFNKLGKNTHAILFDNQRNLFNDNNYSKEKILDKKYKHESEFTYTFTEQDYLSAN